MVHLAVLCVPILLSVFSYSIGHHAKLPQTGFDLAKFALNESLMWGLAFAAAFRISRITITQLCLRAPSVWRVIIYGIGWFILVRIAVFILLALQVHFFYSESGWSSSETVFSMMDPRDIVLHPAFSLAVFGVVSLTAGLTEELWRVGMLRGLQTLFPSLQGTHRGNVLCIGVVSLIFGIAHLYLGWLGVENAVLLGLCFGWIVIYRKSYWEAVIAHTLFDAFSFGMIMFIALHPQILSQAIIAEAAKGDTMAINHLLKIGGDINGTLGGGKVTALEVAEAKGHADVLSFLLDEGANPNVVDESGNTALILAAETGDVKGIKILAAKGADLNLRNFKGETALRFAVANKRAEAVQTLIDLGANVNLPDDKGVRPLQVAQSNDYDEIVELLEKSGAK